MFKRLAFCLGFLCAVAPLKAAPLDSPPAPTDLVATLSQSTPLSVDLIWKVTRPPGVHSFFKVYRSLEDSMHFNLLGVTSDTSFNDRGVSQGHIYYYRVTMLVVENDSTVLESPPSNTAWIEIVPPPGNPHGLIIGTVTDSATGKPLRNIAMMFFCRSHILLWIQQAWTDSLGHYTAILDTGSYLILASPQRLPWLSTVSAYPGYWPQWYDHVYDPRYATPVRADSPASVANFELARIQPPPVVNLSGVVRDTAGNPLANAFVAILRTPREIQTASTTLGTADIDTTETCEVEDLGILRGVVWKGWTGPTGEFTAKIPAGRSYLALAVKRGYLPQFFDHKRTIRDATVIRIPATTRDTSGFDFDLIVPQILLNSVSGVVQDAYGVRVPSHILLIPVPGGGGVIRYGLTNLNGAYTIRFVRTGNYFVMAIPFWGYAPALYKAGAYGVLRWSEADTVFVFNAVNNIDIGVVPVRCGGVAVLAGIVRATGSPVQGATVVAADTRGNVLGYGLTDGDGAYSINGLPAATVNITVDRDGYEPASSIVDVSAADFSMKRDFDLTSVTDAEAAGPLPSSFQLEQNFPNPFNPTTLLRYHLPVSSPVKLVVYDLLGREVKVLVNEQKEAGVYTVQFDARGLASGTYISRLTAGDFVQTRKLVLVR